MSLVDENFELFGNDMIQVHLSAEFLISEPEHYSFIHVSFAVLLRCCHSYRRAYSQQDSEVCGTSGEQVSGGRRMILKACQFARLLTRRRLCGC
jgi:hypothetical protein